ncbi:hypothetical protein FSBG_00051 [Fusobacterium gonidiaformans 3-1-5R]|uniref:Uncharacterized protein n=1 Tax=Fusobacterium gonidiaformans 3-1-5R TaxID=469605 RepID=E5BEM3_9FUSO|nr:MULTISPECIES: hypothetical protein [Fusobacterium]EFS20554.1 hypothetical protein FSBG_00051 [Fusobacterium gonidiaformans 3-1-5R]KYM58569.1 hypothetical protein A2U09_07885 [Fusobacterium necrophorum subsp. funduliforme]
MRIDIYFLEKEEKFPISVYDRDEIKVGEILELGYKGKKKKWVKISKMELLKSSQGKSEKVVELTCSPLSIEERRMIIEAYLKKGDDK